MMLHATQASGFGSVPLISLFSLSNLNIAVPGEIEIDNESIPDYTKLTIEVCFPADVFRVPFALKAVCESQIQCKISDCWHT